MNASTKPYDVAIIGGSIAGSSLALRLARAGIRTVIFDKEVFPRRKACGEGLSDVALTELSELGLAESLLLQDHARFWGYRCWVGNRSVDIASKMTASPKGYGIQRSILDTLLSHSLDDFPHVSKLWGQKIQRVERDGSLFRLKIPGETIVSNHLVLADGCNSITAKRLGIPSRSFGRASWGMSWLLEGEFGQPLREVNIVLKNGYELYFTPVGSNRLNVALLAEKKLISSFSKRSKTWDEITQALKLVGFNGEPVDEPLAIGPIGCTRRPIISDGVFLVGDALESLDPISGMGMTHGLMSSRLVSVALKAIITRGAEPERVYSRLKKDREATFRPYRGFTRLTGGLLRFCSNHQRALQMIAHTSLPERMRGGLGAEAMTLSTILLSTLGL